MKELLNRIRLRWKFEWQYYPSNVKYAIRNFIRWFKIIAKDRDWDQSYFLNIIEFKLKNMIKYWERKDIVRHVDMEADVRYMKICVKLIGYVRDDYYESKAYELIESKWGKSNWRFEKLTEEEKEKLEIVSDDYSTLHIDREGVKTEEDKAQYDAEYSSLLEEARAQHEKARKLLFNIMYNRLEYWWI